MKYFLYVFSSFILFVSDIWTKHFFQEKLAAGNIIIWKDIQLILATNHGIAFSLPITGMLQIVLSLALLLGFIVYIHVHYRWKYKTPIVASALIIGGAIGNLYERIAGNGVTDFIQIVSWFPIFNLADIYIFLGVMLLLIFEYKTTT